MGKAYTCDHCGKYFKQQNAILTDDSEVGVKLVIKPTYDAALLDKYNYKKHVTLCESCTVAIREYLGIETIDVGNQVIDLGDGGARKWRD